MVTETITQKIYVCDICGLGRDVMILDKCVVCGREICSRCDITAGYLNSHFWHKHPSVCKECFENKQINAMVESYDVRFKNTKKEETKNLVELGKTLKKQLVIQ